MSDTSSRATAEDAFWALMSLAMAFGGAVLVLRVFHVPWVDAGWAGIGTRFVLARRQ